MIWRSGFAQLWILTIENNLYNILSEKTCFRQECLITPPKLLIFEIIHCFLLFSNFEKSHTFIWVQVNALWKKNRSVLTWSKYNALWKKKINFSNYVTTIPQSKIGPYFFKKIFHLINKSFYCYTGSYICWYVDLIFRYIPNNG